MLFAIIGTPRSNYTEEMEREALKRFASWSPPAGLEMKALYFRADGRGFIGIYEAASAAAIYESLLPFSPFQDFELIPILDASESVPLIRRARGLD